MFFYYSIPFFCLGILHLIQGLLEKHKAANITKVLLMPLLILTIFLSKYFLRENSLYVIFALFFATLGDKFLIKPVSKKNFLRGVLFFFLGHCFYLLCLLPMSNFWTLPFWAIASMIILYGVIILGVYNILGMPKGFRGFAAVLYTAILVMLGFVCLSMLITNPSKKSIILFIASIIFMISDSILGYSLFKKDFKKARFFIMSTYITAEYLLAYGILS